MIHENPDWYAPLGAAFEGAANVDFDGGVEGQRPDRVDEAPLDEHRGIDAPDQRP